MPDSGRVEARLAIVGDDEGLSRELGFELVSAHLFARLMERAQAVRYGPLNQDRLGPLLPDSARQRIGREFFAMALHVRGVPAGLIYADPGKDAGPLDESRYNAIQTNLRRGGAGAGAPEHLTGAGWRGCE